jgi:hypothetical protein
MHSLKPFFIQLSIFSAFTAGIVFLWNNYSSERFQTNLSWAVWAFFIVVTTLIHYVLTSAAVKNPKKFIMAFMLTTGLKLFGFLILILTYALIKREAALGFTILFLTMYLFFSAFEVVTLLKFFKKQKEQEKL